MGCFAIVQLPCVAVVLAVLVHLPSNGAATAVAVVSWSVCLLRSALAERSLL